MVFVVPWCPLVPSPGHRRRHGSDDTTDAPVIDGDDLKPQSPKAGAFYVGSLDGLLGVAGIMKLIVSQWIIPENSLRLAQVRSGLFPFESFE